MSDVIFRPHPREIDKSALRLGEILKKKFKNNIKIIISNNNNNLQNLFKICNIVAGFHQHLLRLLKDTPIIIKYLDFEFIKNIISDPEIICGIIKILIQALIGFEGKIFKKRKKG